MNFISFSQVVISIYIFVSVLMIQSVTGIDCFQCSSRDLLNPFQCNEYMTDDIDIKPQSCDTVYNAAYCIKRTGRFEGGLGTQRFCSALDHGNYCSDVKQPGDQLDYYRSCVYTCSSDGCNSSVSLKATMFYISALIGVCLIFR